MFVCEIILPACAFLCVKLFLIERIPFTYLLTHLNRAAYHTHVQCNSDKLFTNTAIQTTTTVLPSLSTDRITIKYINASRGFLTKT